MYKRNDILSRSGSYSKKAGGQLSFLILLVLFWFDLGSAIWNISFSLIYASFLKEFYFLLLWAILADAFCNSGVSHLLIISFSLVLRYGLSYFFVVDRFVLLKKLLPILLLGIFWLRLDMAPNILRETILAIGIYYLLFWKRARKKF